eukprot:4652812-Pleurochrysis_carterae.AAC.1
MHSQLVPVARMHENSPRARRVALAAGARSGSIQSDLAVIKMMMGLARAGSQRDSSEVGIPASKLSNLLNLLFSSLGEPMRLCVSRYQIESPAGICDKADIV